MQSSTAARAALIPDPRPTPRTSDAAPATASQMRVLSPQLPFREDETPLSYATRLAALHTGGSPAAFLRDVGVDPQSLFDGKPAAIVKLAEVSGADPATLAHNATEMLNDRLVRCRGEVFDRRLWARQDLRFCAHCMMEDAGWSAKRNASRLRLRFGWDLKFVETCAKHRSRLINFHQVGPLYNGLPFGQNWGLWTAIRHIARQERPVAEPSLQRYALSRLDGMAGPNWLDSLPLDQAAQACHLLGAVALKGARPQSSKFSLEERAEASELGFAITSEGEAGIRRLLTDLQRRCPSRDGHAGPQAMFGDLYDWAARADRDRGPLADILRQHILETVPLGPGDMIFWETVTERRVHSVRTLSLATGVHPKRLRKLLEARGLIDAQDRETHDNRVAFNAAAGEAVARAITDSIPMADLHGRLGLGRAVTTRLVSDGLLTPVLVPDDDLALKERRFLRDEVDGFIERCLADAKPVEDAPPGFDNLRRAASAVATTVAGLLRAILDGRIRERRRLTTGRALGSLIVNVEAVRSVFPPVPDREEYARYRAARRLGTTDRVIAALIADRPGGPILESRPKSNSPGDRARVIPAAAIDAFEGHYVSLIHLARERRLHHLAVAATLHERGVAPAFDPAIVQATFYRRAEIPADI